jgi:hypothetical protein
MRARDVARPSEADLAEAGAEAEVEEPTTSERYRAPSSRRGGSTPEAS